MLFKLLLFTFYLLLFLYTIPNTLNPIYAHAFGALYNLPVPFWLYLYGGAATLLVSFLLVGFFLRGTGGVILKPANHPDYKFLNYLKIPSVLLFLLTILTGLFGVDNSLLNFNMTFFWVIFLLGFYYLTALVGDIYSQINPFKTLFSGIRTKLINYPDYLGYFPALFFFMLLIWIELFFGITPFKLSLILLVYTIVNFLGTSLIGSKDWFKYFEFTSVLFSLIGKISLLRQPFRGLVEESSQHFSLLIFVLFMLSSTAYDGLHTTVPWYSLVLKFGDHFAPVQRLGLILSPLVFLALYLALVFIMKIITKSKLSLTYLSMQFSLTLLPIALVYNVAHYYTLLINQGQQMIRLISDPFGFNWNLFGTADFQGKLFTDAGFIWHSQVAFILLGHVVAVYLAHLVALRIFKNRKQAIISQLPMLVLMILYTTAGLWILSQPLTSKI